LDYLYNAVFHMNMVVIVDRTLAGSDHTFGNAIPVKDLAAEPILNQFSSVSQERFRARKHRFHRKTGIPTSQVMCKYAEIGGISFYEPNVRLRNVIYIQVQILLCHMKGGKPNHILGSIRSPKWGILLAEGYDYLSTQTEHWFP